MQVDSQLIRSTVANPAWPRAGCFISGCPGPEALETLKRAGIEAVVDMRPKAEWNGVDWEAAVRGAGLEFHHVPVGGPDDLTPEVTERIWKLFGQTERVPMFMHCASGNRVAAALALGAWRHGGLDRERALELGTEAGLTKLRPAVEQRMKE